MVRWQKGDGEATPLGPNKHLAILGEPRVPIDISGTKLWVHNPNECFWISKKILENEFWEHYVQSALMNSVGVKRKEKMTTVQVYLWILGLILVLEPFLSSWRQLGIVEAFEPMEYNVELFAQSILENEFQDR